jgi:hypothetical protein
LTRVEVSDSRKAIEKSAKAQAQLANDETINQICRVCDRAILNIENTYEVITFTTHLPNFKTISFSHALVLSKDTLFQPSQSYNRSYIETQLANYLDILRVNIKNFCSFLTP